MAEHGPGAGGAVDWSWISEDDDWVPPDIDQTQPSVARMYDYYLGGKDNYPADREAAEQAITLSPDVRPAARANRAFLLEQVRELAEAGIDQVIDLGTGIPTSPNVHTVMRRTRPDALVVYVDNDPVVTVHNRALLREDARVVSLGRDLRDPASVLEDPLVTGLLDLSRPVGLVMVAVLHFVDLDTARRVMAEYLGALPSGSRIVLTVGSDDGIDEELRARIRAIYARSSSPLVLRSRAQVEDLFEGVDLLPPGIVDVYRSPGGCILGGVGVKP